MTPTVKDRLPDPEGWEAVQDWPDCADELREDIGIPDDPDTERLIIFGESGTGKTRAMKDTFTTAIEYGQENSREIDREYIRGPIWTAETVNSWLKIKDGFPFSDCDPLECFMRSGEDLEYSAWAGTSWDDLRNCSNCPCLKYWPSEDMPLGIDDLQNFTSKKQLLILRNVFEYWPKVAVTIQTPRGFNPGPMPGLYRLRNWIEKQLAGSYGNNQIEAEAVIRRLFEPGFIPVYMQRQEHPDGDQIGDQCQTVNDGPGESTGNGDFTAIVAPDHQTDGERQDPPPDPAKDDE